MTSAIERQMKCGVAIRTPMVPNFLRDEGGACYRPGQFTDKDLRGIAKNWTALLLMKARNQRKAMKLSELREAVKEMEGTE